MTRRLVIVNFVNVLKILWFSNRCVLYIYRILLLSSEISAWGCCHRYYVIFLRSYYSSISSRGVYFWEVWDAGEWVCGGILFYIFIEIWEDSEMHFYCSNLVVRSLNFCFKVCRWIICWHLLSRKHSLQMQNLLVLYTKGVLVLPRVKLIEIMIDYPSLIQLLQIPYGILGSTNYVLIWRLEAELPLD